MPELPEVETFVRALRPLLTGRRIAQFSSSWPRKVHPAPAEIDRALSGARVTGLGRRAKYALLETDTPWILVFHLGMSGRFDFCERSGCEPRHLRARLRFQDGSELAFCDARKFGRILLTDGALSALPALGPEPLGDAFSADYLRSALASCKRPIKTALLDQALIAGVGNIYADETLFRSGIHPLRPACSLHDKERRALRRNLRLVLRQAIRRNGTSFDWVYPGGDMQKALRVYGHGGHACRDCGERISTLRIQGRTAHFCPHCQPL